MYNVTPLINPDLIPEPVYEILRRLEQAGFAAYLVGGSVRDLLMGNAAHDFDITTAAKPEQVLRIFKDQTVIPTGIKYGTVSVLFDRVPFEVTTFRRDQEYLDGRRPSAVTFSSEIEEDLARRDFTINALAWHPQRGLIDLYGGLADIRNKIIRCVGNPDQRFSEDALRILRALRFAAVLGFAIEPETGASILRKAENLNKIAPERINQEFSRLITGNFVKPVLLDYREIFAVFIPEIAASFDFDQHCSFHIYDVYRHTAEVVARSPGQLTLRLAALYHDIAKPLTFHLDENKQGHFYGHAPLSAEIAKQSLENLRFDKKTIERVYQLVKYHIEPLKAEKKFLRRRISKIGLSTVKELVELQLADSLGQNPDLFEERLTYTQTIRALLAEIEAEKPAFTVRDLEINGYDAMAIGLKKEQIGLALTRIFSLVLEEKIKNQRSMLLPELKKIAAEIKLSDTE